MKKCNRYITSLIMTIIYMVIVFSPLTPLAMQSKHVAHAVTGECSGDCKVDGCSLERSAAHACCCWQKKKHEEVAVHLHLDEESSNPPVPATVVAKKRASCCDASTQVDSEKKDAATSTSSAAPTIAKPVTISSIPCGSGKLFALLSVETTQHLPFFFAGDSPPSTEQIPLTFSPQDRLTSRSVDPPEPPPQNS